MKVFKYFDLDGSGVVDFNEFQNALRNFGCVFTE